MTSQTITWKSAADKPDDDTTLLPLTHAASEPVRLGDPDGDTWHFIDGMTGHRLTGLTSRPAPGKAQA